ncbi:MAG: DUF4179 domain-containing protein [Oscillospiraceae bacterium]|nr:DUF4179 domain-containing protein [Oscillospiraceae bacterium]
MKKLYSDLLDSYGEEKIRLKKAPAVSSDRIYALANTKAGKENVFMEKKHHRLPVVLAVVVAAVLLMGAGYLVAYNSITDYFVSHWENMTDTEITDEHLAVIESFSQEIGLSQKSDGVTITVDSAAVGGDTFYVLFAVECNSVEFATTRSPSFDECRWDITNSSATVQSGGLMWGGTDENNVTYFVLEGGIDITDENEPIAVSVHLAGLHTNKASTHEEYPDTYLGGSWDFEFTLEQNTLNPLSLLEDGERKTVTVTMYDTKSTEATHSLVLKDVTVDVTSAVVTEFGITITFDDTTASVPFGTYGDRFEVYALMQDGSEITVYSCSGSDDGTATDDITLKYLWYSVIDMSELKAVRIGDTEFYVNTEESEAIESSVQEIGISETIESDITVTVDSAMASRNEMYFLVKVEGESFMEMLDSGAEWYFERVVFDIDNANMASYGQRSGWDYVEDGVYYSLYVAEYSTIGDDVETLNCSFSYGRAYYFDEDGNKVFIGGPWTIDFTVDVGDVSYVYLTTDIEGVSGFTISEFGVNYVIDTSVNENRWKINVVAVMKDGSEVITGSGFEGTESDEGYFIASSGVVKHWYRQWEVPINLDEVDYLYFVDGAGDFVEGTVIDFG